MGAPEVLKTRESRSELLSGVCSYGKRRFKVSSVLMVVLF